MFVVEELLCCLKKESEEMDCPTEPNISNKIDEGNAKLLMGERFDLKLFRLKLGNNQTMTLEKFKTEVDRADIYFLFDFSSSSSINSAILINNSLKERGFVTWFDQVLLLLFCFNCLFVFIFLILFFFFFLLSSYHPSLTLYFIPLFILLTYLFHFLKG